MSESSVPLKIREPHRSFINNAVEKLSIDPRILGIAIAGSCSDGTMDEFSDLDLVIAVEPAHHSAIMTERKAIVAGLGKLLVAFTGEHVGEPRVLICLFGPPLLHVDLKFVSLPDAAQKVDEPFVVWERESKLSRVLSQSKGQYPEPNLQWIEDRFWVWVHYAAVKIGRGELFEAIEFLSFLRLNVLGPLGLKLNKERPSGVRRIEFLAPTFAKTLTATISGHDANALISAVKAAVEIYINLRSSLADESLIKHQEAETAALAYLENIGTRKR